MLVKDGGLRITEESLCQEVLDEVTRAAVQSTFDVPAVGFSYDRWAALESGVFVWEEKTPFFWPSFEDAVEAVQAFYKGDYLSSFRLGERHWVMFGEEVGHGISTIRMRISIL